MYFNSCWIVSDHSSLDNISPTVVNDMLMERSLKLLATAGKRQNFSFNFHFSKDVFLNYILTCAELLPITLASFFFSLCCAYWCVCFHIATIHRHLCRSQHIYVLRGLRSLKRSKIAKNFIAYWHSRTLYKSRKIGKKKSLSQLC